MFGIRNYAYVENNTGTLKLSNCAMGALSPASPKVFGGIPANGLIRAGLGLVTLNGIYIYGQLRVSSEVNVNVSGKQYANIRWREGPQGEPQFSRATYAFTGTCFNFIESAASILSLVFGTETAFNSAINDWQSNYRWNNIHLLAKNNSDDWVEATRTDVAGGVSGGQDNWKKCGPSFNNFVYECQEYKSPENKARFWNRFNMTEQDARDNGLGAGLAGKFGQSCYDIANDTPSASGLNAGLIVDGVTSNSGWTKGFHFTDQNTIKISSLGVYTGSGPSFFTPAGKGSIREGGAEPGTVDNQVQANWFTESLGNGEIGNYLKHNYLNIQLRGLAAGCDVATGNIIYNDYKKGGTVL